MIHASSTFRLNDLTAVMMLGDCREIAALGKVDAVISDPPYGIDFKKGAGGRGAQEGRRIVKAKIFGDSEPFDPSPWTSYENVILWGADHFYPRLPDSGRFLVWNKLDDMEPWDSFSDVEMAWHSREGAARIFSMKWKGIACDKRGENNGLRDHPTQKPVRLMIWCMEQAKVPQGGLILDPYAGSGTTLIAALRTGRNAIGIEIDDRHYNTACERLDRECRQGVLAL